MNESKTIEEWLNTLVSPVREQALSQCDEDRLPNVCLSVNLAILDFTSWHSTEEGHEYWRHIFNNTEEYTVEEDMKTIEEWLNTLVSPVREQALSQCDEEMLSKYRKSLGGTLAAFTRWGLTEEGYGYWYNIYENIEDYTVKEEAEPQLTNKKNWLF